MENNGLCAPSYLPESIIMDASATYTIKPSGMRTIIALDKVSMFSDKPVENEFCFTLEDNESIVLSGKEIYEILKKLKATC